MWIALEGVEDALSLALPHTGTTRAMGLFSPRKDSTPPPRSASDGSVIGKPRWVGRHSYSSAQILTFSAHQFAVHRNSKTFDRDISLAQHGVAFNSSGYIRPRGGSTSHESDHRSSTDRATYVSSRVCSPCTSDALLLRVTLAQRLNELTASNADGLLGYV